MSESEVIIHVENLTKDYGYGRGVFDISFDIHRGECFGYLGPNGAGKSTTIRHILGFAKPTKGKITVFGLDTFTHGEEILGRVGYLPGEIALPAGLSGYAFLKMEQELRGLKGEPPRLKELLNVFSLDPNMSPKMMSLGDKRKLAVVAAFMNDPEVLILDEPTSGLDPLMQEKFIHFIINEKKRGKTILLSSHLFPEVDATCDRIAIIKDGRHVSSFVANDLKHPGVREYLLKVPANEEKKLFAEPLKLTKDEDGVIHLEAKDEDINKTLEILAKYHVEDFTEKEFSLERYFMSFYKEKKVFNGLSGIAGAEEGAKK